MSSRNTQNCPSYAAFDIVVVAASLGGIEAMGRILSRLPAEFPAGIVLVQHGAGIGQQLGGILRGRSNLPVEQAQDGAEVRPGVVYVAPPDRHLQVDEHHRMALDHGPKVKFCRPSAEPLFTSVAAAYRSRAMGVVLTGCNTDGAIGTQAIKWLGGRVLVQDPANARAAGMPRAAIATGHVDFILPLDIIAPALVTLVMVRGAAEYLRIPFAA